MPGATRLPIEDVLGAVREALTTANRLVLAAPPGAGKTTRLPLYLLEAFPDRTGKWLLLEPRRIAARAAAERMARQLGETVGQTIGLSTRIERRVSDATRIEVITDGLFARRLLADPELGGVTGILFDEFHERSLNVDLGLALSLDVQSALREDLVLIIMSATLETGRIATALKAPSVSSEGRMFPVETRYLGRPKGALEPAMASAIERALSATDGSVLVFLPGAGEIRRLTKEIENKLDDMIDLFPLYGALSPEQQDQAIRPAPPDRRKIVLSTDIAESALTIEGVNTVIDSGLVRMPVFDPSLRRARLATRRASLASVDQRRGRAGRTGPGLCFRLWDEAETLGLAKTITPAIETADLTGLVLSLADWGESEPARLTWLDPPAPGRIAAAKDRLHQLGALDDTGAITPRGRAMAKLPLDPELAALISAARSTGERALAADIAAVLTERGVGGVSTDLAERLDRFRSDAGWRARALRRQAQRWGGKAKPAGDPATLIAHVWPHAIARRRSGQDGVYLTAGGEAVRLEEHDRLAKADWLVVAEAIGMAAGARITLAAPISEADTLAAHPPETEDIARFDIKTRKFSARRVRRLGAIVLSEQPLQRPSGAAARKALTEAIGEHGFGVIEAGGVIADMLARIGFARKQGDEAWPEWAAEILANDVSDWLLVEDSGRIPTPAQVGDALGAHLGWALGETLDRLAPRTLSLPSGRAAPVDWQDEKAPLVSARVQELYGLAEHPRLGASGTPVTLLLTSPAGRPVALTRDLAGFWTGGYRDMAKDMRARYPKHDWPDDPANATAHEGRTKARLAKG